MTPWLRTLLASAPRRAALLSLSFAPLGITVPSRAAEPSAKAQAAAHFERGVELAKEAAYAEALIEFSRAYELSPHYSTLYNIAQAYVGLGKPVQAVDTLKRYLAEGGAQIGIDRRRAVEAELVKQFARTATLDIQVDGSVAANAEVSVDGEVVGRAPLPRPVRVAIGVHRVSVRAENGATSEQNITVAGEEQHTLRFELTPRATSPHTTSPAASPATSLGWLHVTCAAAGVRVSVDGTEVGVTPLRAPLALAAGAHRILFRASDRPEAARNVSLAPATTAELDCGFVALRGESNHSGAQKTWGYVLGAVGIGLGAATVAHFAWNYGRYNDWNDERDAYLAAPSRDKRLHANALGTSIERASAVTIVLGVGAGLALGAGTLLIVTDTSSSKGPRASLSFRGSF
ncbi:MAG TPA: PEGA domain-containing protein [Polyangiaceae bacterium]|nr:PEGA domain-containing protein [Polyangiaceae bacterium]